MGDLHTVGDGASALRFNFGPGYRVCSAVIGTLICLNFDGKKREEKGGERIRKEDLTFYQELKESVIIKKFYLLH